MSLIYSSHVPHQLITYRLTTSKYQSDLFIFPIKLIISAFFLIKLEGKIPTLVSVVSQQQYKQALIEAIYCYPPPKENPTSQSMSFMARQQTKLAR